MIDRFDQGQDYVTLRSAEPSLRSGAGPRESAAGTALRPGLPRPAAGARFAIRPAEPDDSTAIAGYLAEDFGHVYLHLFPAPADVQRTILEEFVRRTEDLPMSYRSFLVAVDARSEAVIGVLGVNPTSPSAPLFPTQDVLTTVGIVVSRLGVGGLVRSFVHDVPLLADLPPTRPKDEALIAAVATDPAWRRHRVASALVDRLKPWARERSFRAIAAEVRSDNRPALAFFTKCGFRPDGEIRSWGDRRLGLSPRVRMVLPLVAEA